MICDKCKFWLGRCEHDPPIQEGAWLGGWCHRYVPLNPPPEEVKKDIDLKDETFRE
jgi:hypothetical protein